MLTQSSVWCIWSHSNIDIWSPIMSLTLSSRDKIVRKHLQYSPHTAQAQNVVLNGTSALAMYLNEQKRSVIILRSLCVEGPQKIK